MFIRLKWSTRPLGLKLVCCCFVFEPKQNHTLCFLLSNVVVVLVNETKKSTLLLPSLGLQIFVTAAVVFFLLPSLGLFSIRLTSNQRSHYTFITLCVCCIQSRYEIYAAYYTQTKPITTLLVILSNPNTCCCVRLVRPNKTVTCLAFHPSLLLFLCLRHNTSTPLLSHVYVFSNNNFVLCVFFLLKPVLHKVFTVLPQHQFTLDVVPLQLLRKIDCALSLLRVPYSYVLVSLEEIQETNVSLAFEKEKTSDCFPFVWQLRSRVFMWCFCFLFRCVTNLLLLMPIVVPNLDLNMCKLQIYWISKSICFH